MSERITDPVHGTTYEFERRGGDLYVETTMKPGGELPKHFHPKQTETWWVIDGEVGFHLDGSWRRIIPEDGEIEVRPGVVHGLRNRGEINAQLGCVASPALGLEEFLTESSRAAREGLFIKGGLPKSWRGLRWAATFLKRFEDETVMTFPPRPLQRLMGPLAR